MNTKDLTKIKALYELSPEFQEAINIIHSDVSNRLHNVIKIYQEQQEDDTHVKSFLEGKKDAYWNIEDLLKKILSHGKGK